MTHLALLFSLYHQSVTILLPTALVVQGRDVQNDSSIIATMGEAANIVLESAEAVATGLNKKEKGDLQAGLEVPHSRFKKGLSEKNEGWE